MVELYDDGLRAVRAVLHGADEALLAVALVQRRGVNLLASSLASVGRARLVATTAMGTTTRDGLSTAAELGVETRVLNPSRGAFHPKLYVARHGDELRAAVGSANLTSGLVANIEAVAVVRGEGLQALWDQAEAWWEHPDAVAWAPEREPAPAEVLHPRLLRRIRVALEETREVAPGDVVSDITPEGLYLDEGARLVDAWRIQIAWDWLTARGTLSERVLAEELGVEGAGFICALLARLPSVRVAGGELTLLQRGRARLSAVH